MYLPLIDIFKLNQFRCLLRINLIYRKEDITIFDQLYNEFWFGKDRANRMLPASQLNRVISL